MDFLAGKHRAIRRLRARTLSSTKRTLRYLLSCQAHGVRRWTVPEVPWRIVGVSKRIPTEQKTINRPVSAGASGAAGLTSEGWVFRWKRRAVSSEDHVLPCPPGWRSHWRRAFTGVDGWRCMTNLSLSSRACEDQRQTIRLAGSLASAAWRQGDLQPVCSGGQRQELMLHRRWQ